MRRGLIMGMVIGGIVGAYYGMNMGSHDQRRVRRAADDLLGRGNDVVDRVKESVTSLFDR